MDSTKELKVSQDPMKSSQTYSALQSFEMDDLRESTEFLNLLVDNVTSAVFLVDEEVRLRQFNNAFEKLFSKDHASLMSNFCGNALGCAFSVDEGVDCGCASHCSKCTLRKSILKAFTEKVPTYKARLDRVFYIGDEPVQKRFIYSSLHVIYKGSPVIMVIVDDFTELENQRLELLQKQMRLDDDLRSAAMIQRSLLPVKIPETSEVSIAAKFVPSQVIGGDIYNVFPLDEDRLVMYMIDVSGHGVTAAMVTVSVSQFLHPATGYFGHAKPAQNTGNHCGLADPVEVLETLDSHYPIERFNEYFTITYLVLNLRSGELEYASAGHPSPILAAKDQPSQPLDTGGTIIGIGADIPFDKGSIVLGPGDRLVLYTDGITEYRGAKDKAFGVTGLRQFIDSTKNTDSKEFVEELFKELMAYGANKAPSDDATLLVIDYHGS